MLSDNANVPTGTAVTCKNQELQNQIKCYITSFHIL